MNTPVVRSLLAAGIVGLTLAVSAGAAVKPVAPTPLSDEEQVIRVIAKTSPAVVSILVQKPAETTTFILGPNGTSTQKNKGDLENVGSGTGFIVSPDGMIVTNRHVAGDRSATYTVILSDDRRFTAKILDIDPLEDLALIKIDAQALPTIDLETNDSLRIGQTVIAIGNALGRYANTAIEKDGQGLGFAIPIAEVRRDIDSFRHFASIARPRLGLRYFMITPELVAKEHLAYDHGALIEKTTAEDAIIPGGPADLAGLKEKDIILSVNGVEVKGKNSLFKLIQSHNVGDRVTLKVARGGDILMLTLTLEGALPYGY